MKTTTLCFDFSRRGACSGPRVSPGKKLNILLQSLGCFNPSRNICALFSLRNPNGLWWTSEQSERRQPWRSLLSHVYLRGRSEDPAGGRNIVVSFIIFYCSMLWFSEAGEQLPITHSVCIMFKSTSLKAVRDGTLWQAQCKACVDLHVSIFFLHI